MWGTIRNLMDQEEERRRQMQAMGGPRQLPADEGTGMASLMGAVASQFPAAAVPQEQQAPPMVIPNIPGMAATQAMAMPVPQAQPTGPVGPSQEWNPTISSPSGTTQFNFSRGPDGNWGGSQSAMGYGQAPQSFSATIDPQNIQAAMRASYERNLAALGHNKDFPFATSPQAHAQAMRLAQMESEPLMDAAKFEAQKKMAELSHQHANSPQAVWMKALTMSMANQADSTMPESQKIEAAIQLANRVASASGGLGGPLGGLGAMGAMAAMNGMGGAGKEPAANISDIDSQARSYLKSMKDALPATFAIQEPTKLIPGEKGAATEINRGTVDKLFDYLTPIANTKPDVAENILRQIGEQSPELRKQLLGRMIAHTAGTYIKDIPLQGMNANPTNWPALGMAELPGVSLGMEQRSQARNIGKGVTNILGDLALDMPKRILGGDEGSRYGNIPYQFATLGDTGEKIPLDFAGVVPGPFNSTTEKSMNEQWKAREKLYKMIDKSFRPPAKK